MTNNILFPTFRELFFRRKKSRKKQTQINQSGKIDRVANEQGIKDESSYQEWESKSVDYSPKKKLAGLYVLSLKGSVEALKWLFDEAYGKSRITAACSKKKRKLFRDKARRYLVLIMGRNISQYDTKYLSAKYLELIGDYHLGLLGNVGNANLSMARRMYSLAKAKVSGKDTKVLDKKISCTSVLIDAVSSQQLTALEHDALEYDFVAFTIARYYFSLMIRKRKKKGKRYKSYREKVMRCIIMLESCPERYADNFFKTVKKSGLLR